MSFADSIALLPFTARGTNAAGFLPPIFRAMGHLLLVVAITADPTDETPLTELGQELRDAKDHWDAINHNQALSAGMAQHLVSFGHALNDAEAEFSDWTPEVRTRNIRDLANRAAGLAALLDRELIGLRDSDPGYQL